MLLWLPSPRRETHLQQALTEARLRIPVATAVHNSDPAAAVWTLAAAPGTRASLHEMPSNHGPDTALNPIRFAEDPDHSI